MSSDYALLLGILNTLCVVLLAVTRRRGMKRLQKIQAYEQVYEDTSFVLTYPFRQRGAQAKARQYTSEDSELQEAVRSYLNAHWMSRMWPGPKFVPPGLKTEDKRAFRAQVAEEAAGFESELFKYHIRVSLPERSPVYYLDDDEVRTRLARTLQYVGRHLSLFSPAVRKCWESAKFLDPEDTRKEYEQALEVCPQFFDHNPRDFDDPFLDLLEAIRQEYRRLVRPRIDLSDWAVIWRIRSARAKLRSLFEAARQPVLSFRVWRKLRQAMRKTDQSG